MSLTADYVCFIGYLLICAPMPKYGVLGVSELADVGVMPSFCVPWIAIAYRPPDAIAKPVLPFVSCTPTRPGIGNP
jgi:hypothetical protein